MIRRPAAIVWAERLGLSAAVLGLVREVFVWNARVALDGVGLAVLFTIGAPLVTACLVLAITQRRSRIALVVLILLTALAWLTTVKLGLTDGSIAFTAGALSLLLQTASLLLILLPTSNRWMRAPVSP